MNLSKLPYKSIRRTKLLSDNRNRIMVFAVFSANITFIGIRSGKLNKFFIINPIRDATCLLFLFQFLNQQPFCIIIIRISFKRTSIFPIDGSVLYQQIYCRILAALFQIVKRVNHFRRHNNTIQNDILLSSQFLIQGRKSLPQFSYFTG